MPELSASGLKNMAGNVSDDGRLVIISFENFDGKTLTTGLNKETLSKTISFLIGLAVETGEKFAPEERKTETITAAPLMVSQIGIGKGRTDSEAFLAVQLGILRLIFSTELSSLLDMCKNLQAIAVVGPEKKPQ